MSGGGSGGDDTPRRTRPRSTPLLAVVGVSIAFVIVGVLLVIRGGDSERPPAPVAPSTTAADVRLTSLLSSSGLPDPLASPLPPADDGSSAAWLTGDGAAAVRMLPTARAIWTMEPPDCDAIEAQVASLGAPEELIAAAAGTPDQATADILLNLRQALRSVVDQCRDVSAGSVAMSELAWFWAVADRRLEQLKVAR